MPHRRVTPIGPQATGRALAERGVRIDVSFCTVQSSDESRLVKRCLDSALSNCA